jgi:NAD(P)H-hydrate epimerase
VLIMGGGPGMPGAVRLAGEAALRVGAGLVTVAVAAENLAAVVGGRPELICLGVGEGGPAAYPLLQEALANADVVAVGPGLGRSAWAQSMLDAALAAPCPLVIDADALNLLAAAGGAVRVHAGAGWILTPHPGEAGRLLGSDAGTVQADRLTAVHALQKRYGGIVVLKGAGTLIADGNGPPAICERGNPGLATPGTGDVLTGAIAGILAQCGDPLQAARAGVMVHALAGDALARGGGERGFLAKELARELRNLVNR